MRILLSPDRLANFNLTPQDVIAAVREQNSRLPPDSSDGNRSTVSALYLFGQHQRTVGREKNSATSFLKAMTKGGILRLKGVARIELGAQDYSVSSFFNGEPAVAICDLSAAGGKRWRRQG